MIRKQGKARWVYRCDFCAVELTAVDQLRILEARNKHLRGNLGHVFNILAEAIKPVADLINRAASSGEPLQKDFGLAPSPNVPHDPSLLKDRRKWGGL
jgi:hypothetical protein